MKSGHAICRALERRGWRLLRIRGSHHIYADPTGKKRLSIPVHAGESLKRGLLARLLKESGLRLEDIE